MDLEFNQLYKDCAKSHVVSCLCRTDFVGHIFCTCKTCSICFWRCARNVFCIFWHMFCTWKKPFVEQDLFVYWVLVGNWLHIFAAITYYLQTCKKVLQFVLSLYFCDLLVCELPGIMLPNKHISCSK